MFYASTGTRKCGADCLATTRDHANACLIASNNDCIQRFFCARTFVPIGTKDTRKLKTAEKLAKILIKIIVYAPNKLFITNMAREVSDLQSELKSIKEMLKMAVDGLSKKPYHNEPPKLSIFKRITFERPPTWKQDQTETDENEKADEADN
uniref:Uncharacterized protein n=1 Tax=Romanomermis culicivorax TaxID=13658 RepID=A0A915JFU4_ROMCU